jgi:hypothetical protein
MRNKDALNAVQGRREEIRRELEQLRHEDTQLEIAERALSQLAARGGRTESPARERPVSTSGRAPTSQREVVLQVLLESHEVWLRSGDIVDIARKRWGIKVPEKSLRPLLSIMKGQGLIVRNGRLIAASQRVNENGRTG